MLPTVDFCGLRVTRLIIGANPFGGFSHQTPERDAEMVAYHTPERIRETWSRAEAAGINTMVTNNETPHVIGTVREYLAGGGRLQWIAQLADRPYENMLAAVDDAVRIGAKAAYFHGGLVDGLYTSKDDRTLRTWAEHARSLGLPIGVAGHAPEVHDWVASLDVVDFHVVCFFNCGSLHSGQGHRFRLADVAPAAECVRRLPKPCIAYKVMGAGRIDPLMALEYAFGHIKPGDVVNVGMHRGDKDGMVEENVGFVREILGA
ncbi:MAG TPA: hypothetical protein PLD23_03615 [Armatimonadota bacterium]|nr:hypothetical protein [Armatimonadota bacterium]